MSGAQDDGHDAAEAAPPAAALQPPPPAPPPTESLPPPLPPAPKASAAGSVFTLINCAVGAPLLSLPFAFQATGWAAGLVLTGGIAAMEAFTLYALARHAEKLGARTYSQLVQRMLGPTAAVLLSLVTIAYAFGRWALAPPPPSRTLPPGVRSDTCMHPTISPHRPSFPSFLSPPPPARSCCAYLMILGDCALPFLEQASGGAAVWWASRDAAICLLGAAVVLPLCFPESLDTLAGESRGGRRTESSGGRRGLAAAPPVAHRGVSAWARTAAPPRAISQPLFRCRRCCRSQLSCARGPGHHRQRCGVARAAGGASPRVGWAGRRARAREGVPMCLPTMHNARFKRPPACAPLPVQLRLERCARGSPVALLLAEPAHPRLRLPVVSGDTGRGAGAPRAHRAAATPLPVVPCARMAPHIGPLPVHPPCRHTNVVAVFHELGDHPVLLPRPASLAALAQAAGSIFSRSSMARSMALEGGGLQAELLTPRRRRQRSAKLLGLVRVVCTASERWRWGPAACCMCRCRRQQALVQLSGGAHAALPRMRPPARCRCLRRCALPPPADRPQSG